MPVSTHSPTLHSSTSLAEQSSLITLPHLPAPSHVSTVSVQPLTQDVSEGTNPAASHTSLISSQVPMHCVTRQSRGGPATQNPDWQVSPSVQNAPSSHAVSSGSG